MVGDAPGVGEGQAGGWVGTVHARDEGYTEPPLSYVAPDGAPRELTANSTGPTTVALSWQAPHAEEQNGRLLSYTLEYSISGSPDTAQEISVPVDSSKGGDQQRVVEGLQPYTTYQFRVRAMNEVGAGPFSNPVVIITQEDGKCDMAHYEKCSLALIDVPCILYPPSSWSSGVIQCNHSVIQCDSPLLDSTPFP